ncbi:MAG TPA: aminopeptidase, partial [Rhodocyclaceae bacterium]|nr:aminopeptidase [Rhodocyclaceae bacterium]
AYARDDTTFNESFAVAVELEGMRRWLERFGTPEQKAAFALERRRRDDFAALVAKYRGRLGELYGEDLPAEAKRAEKARLLAAMGEDYGRLKAAWGGFAGYDKWFAQPINNAQLASVSLSTRLVPAFQELLHRDGGDLPRFYRDVKELAARPAAEREAALTAAGG